MQWRPHRRQRARRAVRAISWRSSAWRATCSAACRASCSCVNRRHVATFNLNRLTTLDTIGLVLYKRIFFHLSNLMHESKRKGSLRFTKDYEAICKEWLGGLKPEKYKSLIISNQLGRHLAALKATGLISRTSIEANKAGDGFNGSVASAHGERTAGQLRLGQAARLKS